MTKHAITIFLAVFSLLCLSACLKEKDEAVPKTVPPRPVKIITVQAADSSVIRNYPAKLRSYQRVKLAFQVPGQIIEFPAKAGDKLAKGALLARLDSRDYTHSYDSALATYKRNKAEFERYEALIAKKAVSETSFEEKRKAFEVSEAELKIADKALADTAIYAPFDGVVASTFADNYQNVQAKQEILSFQDISSVEIVFHVPEKDVLSSNSTVWDPVELQKLFIASVVFPTLGNKTYPLSIKEFETEAESDTQTFRVVMSMPTPDDASILPGMTAIVSVKDNRKASKQHGCVIPVQAVGSDSAGNPFVWFVSNDMKAVKHPVKIQSLSASEILVSEGLKDGDRIVGAGVNYIDEGILLKEYIPSSVSLGRK